MTTLDLSKSGRFVTLDVADQHNASVQVELLDSANTGYDSGTVKVFASIDGSAYLEELWEFTADGLARLDVRAYLSIRAEVGTAALGRAIVTISMTATQTG